MNTVLLICQVTAQWEILHFIFAASCSTFGDKFQHSWRDAVGTLF